MPLTNVGTAGAGAGAAAATPGNDAPCLGGSADAGLAATTPASASVTVIALAAGEALPSLHP